MQCPTSTARRRRLSQRDHCRSVVKPALTNTLQHSASAYCSYDRKHHARPIHQPRLHSRNAALVADLPQPGHPNLQGSCAARDLSVCRAPRAVVWTAAGRSASGAAPSTGMMHVTRRTRLLWWRTQPTPQVTHGLYTYTVQHPLSRTTMSESLSTHHNRHTAADSMQSTRCARPKL
jgi:hypothetical protein